MSTVENNDVAVETEAPKKSVKKSAPAAEKTSTKKIEGIRKPQVRILEALFKAGHPLSRKHIAE